MQLATKLCSRQVNLPGHPLDGVLLRATVTPSVEGLPRQHLLGSHPASSPAVAFSNAVGDADFEQLLGQGLPGCHRGSAQERQQVE